MMSEEIKQNAEVPESRQSPSVTSPPVEAEVEVEASGNEQAEGSGMWGWIKSASNNQFMQKVMEKTGTVVDKMITTLDPGMTPFILEGGDIDIVVTSEKEVKWGAVRDAFQNVFGTATVVGIPSQSNIAPQPVGYTSGSKGAHERISFLRTSGNVDENQVCVSVENFIAEQLPDKWFDLGCILLQDPVNKISIEMFTLAIPVDIDIVTEMQKATSDSYDMRWSGLAVTVGETIQKQLPWVKPSDWHRALTGMSRRDIIYSTALCVAELYKRRLPKKIN